MKYHFEAIKHKVPIVMETDNATELRNYIFTYLSRGFMINIWRNNK